MRYLLTISIALNAFLLFAQEVSVGAKKGLTPITGNGQPATGQTFAVVVGISDYQDEGIPDLRFADKDAEAFAAFLQSPAGGSLDEDHLKVLLNEKATAAQFAIQLDWLMEVAGENDRVIVYFSGHGDVERKTITQPGYLLCWDAPSKVYLAGGAMNVRDLNDVVSTLSVQNKAKVFLITDACRAGKLSGSGIGGAQATAANLAKQFANEIKILSCQPDEYSIEGEQWGGGRGAFSYHLLDGLTGMADRNKDRSVNLMEVRGYLEEKVSMEVAPQSQLPMTIGNGREKLTDVFPEILAQIKAGKRGQLQLFTSTESRGIEDEILAAADSNVVEMYHAFQKAIEEKQFIKPVNASADFYYKKLSQEPQLEKLHSSMRRNYAAALQDDAQQVMNLLLKSDAGENAKTLISIKRDYKQFPGNLRKAASLLGKKHYMYRTLMARSYWFEGYIIDESRCSSCDRVYNVANANKVLPHYQKALTYQPEMPHAWNQMAAVYGIQKIEFDSAEHYANLAIEAIPGWTLVYHWMANMYLRHYHTSRDNESLTNAKKWLDRGLENDSLSVTILNELAYWYNLTGNYEKEQETLDYSFSLEPIAATIYYKSLGYRDWGKEEAAEKALLRAIELDSTYLSESYYLILHYYKTNQDKKAKKIIKDLLDSDYDVKGVYETVGVGIAGYYPEESLELLNKSFETDSSNANIFNFIGTQQSYFQPIDTALEISMIKRALELAPSNALYRFNFGLCLIRSNRFEKAQEAFLKAQSLANDSTWINNHPGLYMLYLQNGMIPEAEKEMRLGMNRNRRGFLNQLEWLVLRYIQKPETAALYFEKIESLYPDESLVNYHFAQHYDFHEKNVEAAFVQLEKTFQKGYSNIGSLKGERKLRHVKIQKERYEALIKKYYPDQFKTTNE